MNKAHTIAMALRAAYLSMHRLTNSLLKHGVTADQFVCLVILSEQAGITQQELVRRATSDPNTMRAMLVLLEKRGLVARNQHPNDGRARHVTITPKGRRIYDKLWQELKPLHDCFDSLFGDDEAKTLVVALKRISETMTYEKI
jgi:DNA-binding MarR family transcriptional regulator